MSVNKVITANTEALFEACVQGDTAKVQALLAEKDTEIDYKNFDQYGETPLFAAIKNKKTDAALLLLKAGADVSIQNTPELSTPLHEACTMKNSVVVKKILEQKDTATVQGVDQHDYKMTECENAYGNTPVHSAAFAGSVECLKLLHEAGAPVDLLNHDKSTPLHHACYAETDNAKVIEFLIKLGSNINALDEREGTPLMVAAKKNQVTGARILLESGADVKLEDASGYNALYYAKHKGHNEITDLLN